jgi:uroporphyrinogen decarboxylase
MGRMKVQKRPTQKNNQVLKKKVKTNMTQPTLLEVAQGKKLGPQDKTPVWFMRQAGRYLPEYRALREKHSTKTMFFTPDIATKVSLMPLEYFPDLDGVIVYSDILLLAETLGLGLDYIEGFGPKIANPLDTPEKIDAFLKTAPAPLDAAETLTCLYTTITNVHGQLPAGKNLLGFCACPFTLACYLVEGQGSKSYSVVKRLLYAYPSQFYSLLEYLRLCIEFCLEKQVFAGAQMVQIFESWSGAIGAKEYMEFCLPGVIKIVNKMKNLSIPISLYWGNGGSLYSLLPMVKPTIYSVDWKQSMENLIRQPFMADTILQGNLDPQLLLCGNTSRILKYTAEMLEMGRQHKGGFIFNLGHGILPQTDPAVVRAMIDLIKDKG